MEYFDSKLIELPPNKIGIYKKPLYYGLIHILIGFISFYYYRVGLVFIFYQLSQLILNKRFFIFQWRIEEGNSISHTGSKMTEFLLGILLAFIINKKSKNLISTKINL